MKTILRSLSVPALLLLTACSGSQSGKDSPAVASAMTYTDPAPAATDWKLVKDPSSTGTRLVLNLVGPANGTKFRGIGITLQADPARVKFARFTDGAGKPLGYYKDAGVFRDTFLDTTDTTPVDMPPTLQAGGVNRDKLMVGIYQKGDDEIFYQARGIMGPSAKTCDRTVLQIALALDPALKATAGTVPLTILKARAMPEHVDGTQEGQIQNVSVKVGTLTLE